MLSFRHKRGVIMLYYVFYAVAAVNFAAFIVSLVMLAKESLKYTRYGKVEEYIRRLEMENLKHAV